MSHVSSVLNGGFGGRLGDASTLEGRAPPRHSSWRFDLEGLGSSGAFMAPLASWRPSAALKGMLVHLKKNTNLFNSAPNSPLPSELNPIVLSSFLPSASGNPLPPAPPSSGASPPPSSVHLCVSSPIRIQSCIFPAMSHVSISRLSCIHCHRTPLPLSMQMSTKRKQVTRLFKAFSSLSSATTSPATSHSPPLMLVAKLSPSDAPQRSEEWFALRKDRLTTSTFSTALGVFKGNRRAELWNEKVFPLVDEAARSVTSLRAMEWGVMNEAVAVERYKTITGNDVSSLGFAVHPDERLQWLGASPDGLLGSFPDAGILEVKCPFNKGKPELGLPWSTMPFYYMPQVQGQMEVMNREWVDLYCWTPIGSTLFRVYRDRGYWNIIHDVLREFWWENVVPAREAVLLGDEDNALSYKPASTHKRTGLVIATSIKLAAEAKLLSRELAGHVEFYR